LAWAGKGFWAVVVQALFAGTNFLVNILLARWLEPEGYGAFALGYSLFLLLGTLHTALWTEPMMVYGAKRFREAFGPYRRVLIGDHWRFGFAASLLFLLCALVFANLGRQELALSFGGLAVAAPAVLYLWLVQRNAYVHLEPRLAAFGGVLYLVIYLLLAFFLLRLGLLNEATAYLAMGLAALLAGKAILWRLPKGTGQAVDPREVRALHWAYGRWALLAGLLSWVPANLPLVVLAGLKGLEASALFRAPYSLYMPVLPFQTALNSLFLPLVARRLATGPEEAWGWTKRALLIHTVPAAMYLLVVPWVEPVVGLVYGGRFPEAAKVFLWLLPVPFLAAATNALEAWHRGRERSGMVAKGYAVAALATALILPLAVAWGGVWGAALSLALGKGTLAAVLYLNRER